MRAQLAAFAVTVTLGVISAGLGYALYKFGSAQVKRQGTRVSGAVAIAGLAFLLMSEFYLRLLANSKEQQTPAYERAADMLTEYDTCLSHEKEVARCAHQSSALRDACETLVR
jgi:hypothetical protein